jgi:hypothetical protein
MSTHKTRPDKPYAFRFRGSYERIHSLRLGSSAYAIIEHTDKQEVLNRYADTERGKSIMCCPLE